MQPTGNHINFSEHPHNLLVANKKSGVRSYRFGYQGSEKDDEIFSSTGTVYTTFYRGLDVRTARWFTPDPENAKTPWESPYASMGLNPIIYNDILGNKIKGSTEKDAKESKNQISESMKIEDDDISEKFMDFFKIEIGRASCRERV